MKTKVQKQTHGAQLEDNVTVASLLSKHKKQSLASVEEYSKYINSLGTDELHNHSVMAGEVPVDNRTKLIDRLEKRFARALGKNVTAKESEFDVVQN